MKHIPAATIGLDLAKNIFQVHGADSQGKKLFNKAIKRDKLAEFFQLQTPCIVAMEACSSANHWARKLQAMGHEVRLIAPQHVKPYVQGNKHDAADASAICEAAVRPRMRFVPIKTPEQQADLSLHRARTSFIKARTAQDNQIRGFLAEYGLILPQGIAHIALMYPNSSKMPPTNCPADFASSSKPCSITSNASMPRCWRSIPRSKPAANPLWHASCKPSPASAPSPPAPWSPASAKPAPSKTAGS
jgi:transposase